MSYISDLNETSQNVDILNAGILQAQEGSILEFTSDDIKTTSLTASTAEIKTNLNLSSLTPSKPLKLDVSKNVVAGDIDLVADTSNVLPIAKGGTNSSVSLFSNRFMVSRLGTISEASELKDGEIFVGVTSSMPLSKTLQGTANRIIVSNNSTNVTFSTPQDLATSSSVTFANLGVTGQLDCKNVFSTTGVSAPTGIFQTLTSTSSTSTSSTIGSLTSTTANIATLSSTSANLTSATIPSLTSTTSNISTLTSTSANLTSATIPSLTSTTINAFTGSTTGTNDPTILLTPWNTGSKFTRLTMGIDSTNRNRIRLNSSSLGTPGGAGLVLSADGVDQLSMNALGVNINNLSITELKATNNVILNNGLTASSGYGKGVIWDNSADSGNMGYIKMADDGTQILFKRYNKEEIMTTNPDGYGNIITTDTSDPNGQFINGILEVDNLVTTDINNGPGSQTLNIGTTSSSSVSKTVNIGSQSNAFVQGTPVVRIGQNGAIEFGTGVTNKEANAGKILYGGAWDVNALNVVGAGSSSESANRVTRFYDRVAINGSMSAAPNAAFRLQVNGAANFVGSTRTTGFMYIRNSGSFDSAITSSSQTAERLVNIPTVPSNCDFVLTQANQTIQGTKTFSTVQFQNSNAVPLNFHGRVAVDGNFIIGSISTGTQVICSRTGDQVMLRIGAFVTSPTTSSVFTSTFSLSVDYRPIVVVRQPIIVRNGGVDVYGTVEVNTSGIISFGVGPTLGNFSTGSLAGIAYPGFVNYVSPFI